MKKNKIKKQKEPSLIVKLINIYFEQAKRRKAIRLLQKQSWSFDFLSLLLVKASKTAGQGLSLEIVNKEGTKFILTYNKALESDAVSKLDDSIFNHLDDDMAVADFIARHSVR